MITDTSQLAYTAIKPDLTDKQLKVYDVISRLERPVCSYEIAQFLHWPINRVTGRINELYQKHGVLVDMGARMSPTGFKAHYWVIKKETLF